ncbi:hypothetical protein DPMN_077319 [Dreissena polymorpha]|uniref:Uncharacterized protein n=1 Tax=Dreissena polymorpha TaxID=45954 RepID=A0A9D3YLP8_DREPO|nr:hypothetical protein DPMN_077319 [Dreissena polymorpha]
MSGRIRSVRRRLGQAVAKQTERDGGCGRQLIRPRRRNKGPDGVEGMRRKRPRYQSRHQLLFLDHSQRQATAAAPPAKRKRSDDNAANGEVVDFCDIFRTAE